MSAGVRVTVLEGADTISGTTAISGGGMWLPGNRFTAERGQPDDPEEVVTYLQRLTFGRVPRARHESYFNEARRLSDFLEANTPIEFEGTDNPDYQNILPGSRQAGRQVAVGLYDSSRLGEMPRLGREKRQQILCGNAIDLYGLPSVRPGDDLDDARVSFLADPLTATLSRGRPGHHGYFSAQED